MGSFLRGATGSGYEVCAWALAWRGNGMERAAATRSSEIRRKGNALASGADEGRDKLRKATGSGTYASIRRCPNGGTRLSHTQSTCGE